MYGLLNFMQRFFGGWTQRLEDNQLAGLSCLIENGIIHTT